MAKYFDPLIDTYFDARMWKRDYRGTLARWWKGDRLVILWRKGGGYWWRHRVDGETRTSSVGFATEREAQINLARTLGVPTKGL